MKAQAATARPLTAEQQAEVLKHLPLALSVMKRTQVGRYMHEDDRRQVAIMGLMRVVQCYDPSRGYAFSTFASHCIYRAMQREGHKDGLVKIPHYLRSPSAPEHLVARLAKVGYVVSLEGDVADERKPDPIHHDERDRQIVRMWAAIRRLPPRLKTVAGMRARGVTLDAIGRQLGISKERVRQLETVAIRILRTDLGAD